MDSIGAKILLFAGLAVLFVTVIVKVVYPMIQTKTNDVQTTISNTATTGFIFPLAIHPTLGDTSNL